MDIARTVTLGLAATLLLGAARFDLAVAQDAPAPPARRALPAPQVNVDVKPRVELNRQVRLTVEPRDDVQRAIEAQAAAVKAQADINVAHARAQAAAETDPRTKEILRRNAEEKAAEAAVTKANADLTVAQAREAWQQRETEARQRIATEGVTVQQAERMLTQARQRGAMAMSETALARTQEALARQAQAQARDKADPGKQQLMQLMADSVAVARAEMAQARERADQDVVTAARQQKITVSPAEVDARVRQMGGLNGQSPELARQRAVVDVARAKLAENTAERGTSYTLTTRQAPPVGGATSLTGVSGPDAEGNYTMEFGKPGSAEKMALKFSAGKSPDYVNRFDSGTVHIDAEIDAAAAAAVNRPETMAAITTAMRDALAEAGRKIDAAIAQAKAAMPPVPPPPAPLPPVPALPN